jgi:hypothetical protein
MIFFRHESMVTSFPEESLYEFFPGLVRTKVDLFNLVGGADLRFVVIEVVRCGRARPALQQNQWQLETRINRFGLSAGRNSLLSLAGGREFGSGEFLWT